MNVPADLEKRIDEVITHYPVSKRSASLPLLHLIQEHFGYIPDEAIEWIAAKLGLQPINIYELVTFYPWFRRRPLGRKHIMVCRTLSCALAGSNELCHKLKQKLGLDPDSHDAEVTADGEYSIEYVECLASCGTAPVVLCNEELHEKVTPDQAEGFLSKISQK